MAWLPLLAFKPFVKVGYALFGSSEMKVAYSEAAKAADGIDTVVMENGKVSGYLVTLGLAWNFAPFCSLILNYTMHNESSEYSKISFKTSAGSESNLDLVEKVKFDNSGNVIGLGVGFSI